MCRNKRYVINKETGKRILVECGKCKSCRQKAANKRARRIRESLQPGYIQLFVSLTYHNSCVPYVFREDFEYRCARLAIHRDSVCRRVRDGVKRSTRLQVIYKHQILDVVDNDTFIDPKGLKDLKKYKGRVGVCYYDDFSDFIERLRINLKRKYNYDDSLQFYNCSEYGEKYGRPHFHTVFNVKESFKDQFVTAIYEAWPYALDYPCGIRIETAVNISRYVASYVNSGSDFPEVLKQRAFRPRWSYSQGYGVHNPMFSLDKILQKISSRDLRYPARLTINKQEVIRLMPIPDYITRRYFPVIEGYSRLTSDQIRSILDCPAQYRHFAPSNSSRFHRQSYEDVEATISRIRNCKSRYEEYTGSLGDYADKWLQFQEAKRCTLLKSFYENEDRLPVYEQYDNISEVFNGKVCAPTLEPFLRGINIDGNYNNFPHVVEQDNIYTKQYDKKCKTREMNEVLFEHINNINP